jgi:hypothetical protein
MKTEELTNPVVRAMVTAMHDGDRKAFFAVFAPSAKLTDDGNAEPRLPNGLTGRSSAHMVVYM